MGPIQRPPDADELEVSIIGPGRGESVILHLGNNEWAVVDSCFAKGSTTSAAADYLSSLDPDAPSRLQLVLATHWHDDHIRGISQLLAMAPAARFACSTAFRDKEFLALVGLASDPLLRLSGPREIAAVIRELNKRREAGAAPNLYTPQYAIADRVLLDLRTAERPFPVKIVALSPSDPSVQAGLEEIANLIPKPGELPGDAIVSRSPNHTSVVVWIEAGGQSILLGADLENHSNAAFGWKAVVGNHTNSTKGKIFKVPHHGSVNADNADVWDRMLEPNPIALLSPFNGGRWLPTETDCARISGRTPDGYCTARQPPPLPRRGNFVEKQIRSHVIKRQVAVGPPGQVRIRWKVAQDNAVPSIELFHYAYQLPASA